MGWQKNLYVMVLVQFVMMLGFSSMSPFLPFFVQELGVTDPRAVDLWSGLLASTSPLFAAVASPFWGSLADRRGRKPMVVRASLAAGLVTTLISYATSVHHVLLLRVLQGTFGGFSAAALALVAAQLPKEKLGYGLGLLQTGQVLGIVVGPTLGGLVADYFSYRAVFQLNGLAALAGALLTLVLVHEEFQAPPTSPGRRPGTLAGLRLALAVPSLGAMFLVLFLAQFAVRSVEPILSLYVGELAPHSTHLASTAGAVFAATGLAQVIGLFFVSRYSERLGYRPLLLVSLLGAGLLYFPQALAASPWQLMVYRFLFGLFLGGILPLANALIGLLAPAEMKGRVFGVTSVATFLGNFSGPLVGGVVAAYLGLRAIFYLTGALLLVNFLWAWSHAGKTAPTARPARREENPPGSAAGG